ncbi:MAG: EVE domain-containing protein [Candidatus Acidiferrales bacterium]
MRQFWLFGANPGRYKFVDELRLGKADWWYVKQFRDKLRRGDKVILWQSGDEAGIYAFGMLANKPYKIRNEWRVDIKYDPLMRRPVFKRELKKHPVLRDMAVLKMPRGRNPFRVKKSEWLALQELISKDTVCIFTHYQSEENSFTNGLVALLELSSRIGGSLPAMSLLHLIDIEPQGEIGSFRVLSGFDGHADAELCGPRSCIRFETKIGSGALDEDQIKRHLRWLERVPQAQKVLVLLTPDDGSSRYIKEFLSSKRIKSFCSKNKDYAVRHLEWKAVHDHLKRAVERGKATTFSLLVTQFLDQIRDRIFEQDFAGVITKIAFESGNVDPDRYLDDLRKRRRGDEWNLPNPIRQLDGTHRKLLFYHKDRGITAEVEVKEMRIDRRNASFPAFYVFADKPSIFEKPISLSHIRSIHGFKNFGVHRKDRSPYRNITREQYAQLIGEQSA